MRIRSLTFGRSARTPSLRGLGIAITVTKEPQQDPGLVVYGTCRIAKADLPAGRQELPRGIVLVAINPVTQGSYVVNLVGERLVFEDDAEEAGSECTVAFRCALEPGFTGNLPTLFHASCRQYVSDVLWVVP
ncbi:hypothetical protein [Hyalangium versicolor]|uniref:hypothetical protein n=1 Tax=Hyalangium versicolor TaxID=2861190 RepID=UPI001CCFA38F|nr:hypothetical protein [Hyalangium versicolor]